LSEAGVAAFYPTWKLSQVVVLSIYHLIQEMQAPSNAVSSFVTFLRQCLSLLPIHLLFSVTMPRKKMAQKLAR